MTAYQNTGNTNIPRESPYERSVSPIDDVHLYSSMNGNDIESSTGYQSLSNIRPGQQHQYTSIAISNEQTNSYAVYEEPYPDTAYEEPTISPNQDMGYEEPIIPSEQVTRYEELGPRRTSDTLYEEPVNSLNADTGYEVPISSRDRIWDEKHRFDVICLLCLPLLRYQNYTHCQWYCKMSLFVL